MMSERDLVQFARDDKRLTDADTIARAFVILHEGEGRLPHADGTLSALSVAYLLVENKYAPPEMIREVWHGAREARSTARSRAALELIDNVLRKAAHNPNAPSDVLMGAASSKSESVRLAAAANKRWQPEAMAMVADQWIENEGSLEVLKALASNPSLPLDALERLSFHQANTVRRRVAGSRRLSPERLDQLASDDSPMVRRDVARNPSTPFAALQRLGVDEHPKARREAYDTARVKLVRECGIERDNTQALDFLLGDLTPEVHSQHQDDLLANPPAWTRRTFSENEIKLALLVHPNTGKKEARR